MYILHTPHSTFDVPDSALHTLDSTVALEGRLPMCMHRGFFAGLDERGASAHSRKTDTLHTTFYTLHFTHYTSHSTLHTLHHFTHYILHSTLYTLHFTLYTPYLTLYSLHSSPTTRHQHPSATFTLRAPLLSLTPIFSSSSIAFLMF